jgi:hypothetical protein
MLLPTDKEAFITKTQHESTNETKEQRQSHTPQDSKSFIERREELIAKIKEFNLLSNVFMSVALNDKAACQYVLRQIIGISDLIVREVRSQYRISKLISHDAVLDILAEDSRGKLYSIEIQRETTIHHPKRIRFYSAMIDSEYLAKGKTYLELPDLIILYISETDLWKAGKVIYHVQKRFEETGQLYDDGQQIICVNAAVDDGSPIAKLMQYFKTSNPEDMSYGILSERVRFLKQDEGGIEFMCQIANDIYEEGREEGLEQGELLKAKDMAYNLARLGVSLDKIAEAAKVSIQVIRQWLDSSGMSIA